MVILVFVFRFFCIGAHWTLQFRKEIPRLQKITLYFTLIWPELSWPNSDWRLHFKLILVNNRQSLNYLVILAILSFTLRIFDYIMEGQKQSQHLIRTAINLIIKPITLKLDSVFNGFIWRGERPYLMNVLATSFMRRSKHFIMPSWEPEMSSAGSVKWKLTCQLRVYI